ncbi:MAG: murein biosynthesis integral membrane protein MurJ, partial [Sedimentisphaerales bacterium]|nr:murein biosynthesis integral membrane protein MurJ [Sedimentisphaerales bacterium]
MSKQNHSFVSAAKVVALLTLLSRVLGLVRDALMARYFGAVIMHYFGIPFQVPNLVRRLFGEGALTAALIPVYTDELKNDPQQAQLLARSVLTLLITGLTCLTLVGIIVLLAFRYSDAAANYDPKTIHMLSLGAIMLPYMIFICYAAVVGGLLQVHRHFIAPALVPAFLNTTIIIGVYGFARFFGADPWQQIYAAAWSVFAAGLIQIAVQIPAMRKFGISPRLRFTFNEAPIRRVFTIMAPMMIGLAAVQINTVSDNLIAFYFSSSQESGPYMEFFGRQVLCPVNEGSVNYLYNAQRCYQFPLGVFGVALATAIFPFLSSCVSENDMKGFARQLNHGIRLTIFIGLPSTLGLMLISGPMVRAIFEGGEFTAADSAQTASTVIYYAAGVIAYCMQQLVVRAFYSFKDSKTPVNIAVKMIFLNFFMNLILIWPLATGGLGLSTAICASIQAGWLLYILIKRK